MPLQSYRYWAFVSYSRHDARVAGRLLDRLRRAPVPRGRRAVVEGAPGAFEPVYLDTGEAPAASRLDDELQAAMRASAKLIVLCSPFSALSGYVADEIRYFQSIGRADDILCLIVSGVPGAAAHGTPQLECFPAPLLAAGTGGAPLAASLGQETDEDWRHAIDQLTAGMLGDSLQHRRDWLGRRRRRRLAVAAAGLAGTAALAGVAAWALWLPQQVYATDGVRRWGAWEPIGLIDAGTAAQRPKSLRFSRRGALGRWSEVRWVDGRGECAAEGPPSIVGDPFAFQCSRSRACGVRMTYSDGKLTSEQVFDQYDQAVETLTYPLPGQVVLNEAVIGCSRRPGDIETVALERHAEGPLAGVDQRLQFGGGENKTPRPNAAYAFGLRDEHDTQGRVVQRWILDAQGIPRVGASGYAAIRTRHGALGAVVEQTTLGLDGRPVEGRKGYATIEREVDAQGRTVVERYLDARRQPAHDENGVHAVRMRWSDQGMLTEAVYVGVDGRPTLGSGGVAIVRHAYAQGGDVDRESYFDTQDRPAWNARNGCATMETHEPRGELWRTDRCFDPDGKATVTPRGWHLRRTTYSARGQELSEAYFGIDDKPTLCSNPAADKVCPIHRAENRFDDRGMRVGSRFLDAKGEPALGNTGAAGLDLVYNARGRIQRWIHIGIDGKPAPDADGALAQEKFYDAYGRLVETRSVDAAGQPRPLASGVSGEKAVYDALGNIAEEQTFDRDGRPATDKTGHASTRYRHDSRGRMTEWRAFDAQHKPAANNEGWYGAAIENDAWGRPTLWTRLGPDGEPQPGDDGVLSRRVERDARGHRVRLQLLGEDGKAKANRGGIADFRYVVDVRGHVLGLRTFDALGQPAADRRGQAGFDATYDARGHQVRFTRIGVDGSPVASSGDGIATTELAYDERGQVSERRHFDPKGRPQSDSTGIFGYRYQYNERGQQRRVDFLGADGHPASNNDGVARYEADHDAAGGMTEARYFDASGALVRGGQAPIVRHRNDAYGRELERTYFDAANRPIVSPGSGRARTVFTRDQFGRVTSEESFGPDGNAVDRKDTGWSRRTFTYDDMGQAEAPKCFSVAGTAVRRCNPSD